MSLLYGDPIYALITIEWFLMRKQFVESSIKKFKPDLMVIISPVIIILSHYYGLA